MNTDKVRKRFQASHPKLPTQVLDKYWGGIGYKDRTTQEQWKGYQQATKESEALKKAARLVVLIHDDFDNGNDGQLITVRDCIQTLRAALKEADR